MDHKVKLVIIINVFVAICVTGHAAKEMNGVRINKGSGDIMDVSDFSVYYDLNTNEIIRKMMPRPWYKPGWPLRLPFSGGPCTCESFQCTCCSGMRIPAFNFDRQICSKLSYNTSDSMIDMVVTLNGDRIYNNSYSARNPPPFCVPVPVPYLPPGLVDFCVRLFDVSVVDQKLHVCMDMDTRVDKAPVLVLHFDCMNMGLGGVSLSKPGSGGTPASVANVTNETTSEPEQISVDVYDPVEEKFSATENPFTNSIKYI